MKLLALLSALLVAVIIMATPAGAQAIAQNCTTETQQSSECCEARELQPDQKANYNDLENCGQRLDIVKTIIPIIGIILLAGGIIGAVIWERRRLG